MKRILVTGPVESLDDWAEAARSAGWDALAFPLVVIEPLAVAFDRAELERADCVLVTSSNALPALLTACEAAPSLRSRPLHVVGARTAARARALGLEPRIVATDAHELARLVLALDPRPKRALWPRGSLSDELARALRGGGLAVDDRVVYTTRDAASEPAPPAEAVFLASPSAVRAWRALPGSANHPARIAIAIGATTLAALHAETGARFPDILSLPRASSRELALLLTHLDVTP
ncbi:MAG: uroporphyrinogen-III synthase [Planctomycetota bacterium]